MLPCQYRTRRCKLLGPARPPVCAAVPHRHVPAAADRRVTAWRAVARHYWASLGRDWVIVTCGLAYLLYRDVENKNYQLNTDSVRFARLESSEEQWLRRILRRHLQLTGSPRAAQLLSQSVLPLLRVEPLAPPCSTEVSWAAILEHVSAAEIRSYGREPSRFPETERAAS